MYLRILLILLVAAPSNSLLAQQADSTQVDLVDVFIGRNKFKEANKIRSDRKVYFSFFPAPVSTVGRSLGKTLENHLYYQLTPP